MYMGLEHCPYVTDGHDGVRERLQLVMGACCLGASKALTIPSGSLDFQALAQPRTMIPLMVHLPTNYFFLESYLNSY